MEETAAATAAAIGVELTKEVETEVKQMASVVVAGVEVIEELGNIISCRPTMKEYQPKGRLLKWNYIKWWVVYRRIVHDLP